MADPQGAQINSHLAKIALVLVLLMLLLGLVVIPRYRRAENSKNSGPTESEKMAALLAVREEKEMTELRTAVRDIQQLIAENKNEEAAEVAKDLLSRASSPMERMAANHWSGVAYYKLGEYELAAKAFMEAIRLDPQQAVAPNAMLASTLMMQKKYTEAVPYAKEAIRLNPDFALAHNLLGKVLLETDKKPEGIKELELAVKLAPGNEDFKKDLERTLAK